MSMSNQMSRRPRRRRPALEIFGASGDRPIVSGGQNHYLRGSSYALRRREAGLSRQSQQRQRQLNNQIKLIKELQKQLQEAKQSNDPIKLARLEQKLKECEDRRTADQSQLKQLGDMIAECERQRQQVEDKARGEQKLSVNEIYSLETDNKKLTEALERCEAEKQEVESLRKQLKKALDDKNFAEVTADDMIKQRDELATENRVLRQVLGTHKGKGNSQELTLKLQMCSRDLDAQKDRNKVLKELLEKEQQQVRNLRKENEILNKRLTAGMESKDTGDYNQLKLDFEKLEQDHVRLGQEYETLTTDRRKDAEQLGKINNNLLKRNASLEKQHTALIREMGQLRKQLEKSRLSVDFYRSNESNLQNKIDELNKQIKNCLASKSESKTADDPVVRHLREELLLARQSLEDCRERLQQTTDEYAKERATQDMLSRVVTSKLQIADKEKDKALRKLAECDPDEMRKLRIEKDQLHRYLANFRKVSEDIVAMQRKAEADKDKALKDLAAHRNSGESKEGENVKRLQAKIAQLQRAQDSWSKVAGDVVKAREDAEADKNEAHENLRKCEEYVNELVNELNQINQISDFNDKEEEDYKVSVETLRTKLAACQKKLRQCEADLGGGESKENTKPRIPKPAPPIPSKKTPSAPVTSMKELNRIRAVPKEFAAVVTQEILPLLRWYAIFEPTSVDGIQEELKFLYDQNYPGFARGGQVPGNAVDDIKQYRSVLYHYLKKKYEKLMNDLHRDTTWPPKDTQPNPIKQILYSMSTLFTNWDYASDIELILTQFDDLFRDLGEEDLVDILRQEMEMGATYERPQILRFADPVPVQPVPVPILNPDPPPPPSPTPVPPPSPTPVPTPVPAPAPPAPSAPAPSAPAPSAPPMSDNDGGGGSDVLAFRRSRRLKETPSGQDFYKDWSKKDMKDLLKDLRDKYNVNLNIDLTASEGDMRRELNRLEGDKVIRGKIVQVLELQPVLRF